MLSLPNFSSCFSTLCEFSSFYNYSFHLALYSILTFFINRSDEFHIFMTHILTYISTHTERFDAPLKLILELLFILIMHQYRNIEDCSDFVLLNACTHCRIADNDVHEVTPNGKTFSNTAHKVISK